MVSLHPFLDRSNRPRLGVIPDLWFGRRSDPRSVPLSACPICLPDSPLIPPPTGTDIRLTSAASARGRSSGRMLGSATTSEGDVVGLALLRLEQVGAVTRGEGEMTIEVEGGAKWNVQPREPDWWPRMVVT